MFAIIGFIVAAAATYFGYSLARDYTASRLKFVDAVQRPGIAWIAGAVAFVVALPIAWMLPFFSGVTAALFGASVGFGVSAGAKKARGYLPPG